MDEAVIAEIITLLGKLAGNEKIDPDTVLKILNALTKGGNSGGNTPNPDVPAGGSVRSALDALTDDQRDYINGLIDVYLTTDLITTNTRIKTASRLTTPQRLQLLSML